MLHAEVFDLGDARAPLHCATEGYPQAPAMSIDLLSGRVLSATAARQPGAMFTVGFRASGLLLSPVHFLKLHVTKTVFTMSVSCERVLAIGTTGTG